jgi:hypothetical protein
MELSKIPLIKVSYVTVAQQCAQNCKIPHIGVRDITAIVRDTQRELCGSVMETRNCYEQVTNLVTQRTRLLRGDSERIPVKENCSSVQQELMLHTGCTPSDSL